MISRRAACLASAGLAIAPRALRAAGRDTPRVLVVGAGLAGLYAAMILEREGIRTLVLEASRRVGGRVITLDDVPGRPEAGLAVIGGMYGRVLDVCEQLKLPLEVPVQMRKTEATRMLNIGGANILHDDWPASDRNPFPDRWRKHLPDMALSQIMLEENPFRGLDDWIEPAFAKYDIPTYDYLKSRGLNDAALRLLEIGAFTDSIRLSSYLHDMRIWNWVMTGFEQQFAKAKHVVGGNQRLPEAMAVTLKSEIRFARPVVRISTDARGVEVLCAGGERFTAERIICTVPFPVLRRIEIDPEPPALQREAIDTIPYLYAMQIYMVPKTPYWRNDGLPPGMWTDSPVEGIRALAHGEGGTVSNIICDLTGRGAYRFSFMSDAEIGAFVLDEIARLRPAAKGQLEVAKIVNKPRERFAQGDWPYWKAGQVSRFARDFAKPHGRVHFAGDGTAILNRGAEAALESAERAALEVLNTI
jgi:monoamine oxidase